MTPVAGVITKIKSPCSSIIQEDIYIFRDENSGKKVPFSTIFLYDSITQTVNPLLLHVN